MNSKKIKKDFILLEYILAEQDQVAADSQMLFSDYSEKIRKLQDTVYRNPEDFMRAVKNLRDSIVADYTYGYLDEKSKNLLMSELDSMAGSVSELKGYNNVDTMKKTQVSVSSEVPKSVAVNTAQGMKGSGRALINTLKSPVGITAGSVAGLSLAAWAAIRIKLQRDLRKAIEEGDHEKVQLIRNKIRNLNRVALAAGLVGTAGAGLGALAYKKYYGSGNVA